MNYWDFAYLLLILLAAGTGWKMRSLTLLGIGFGLILSPWAAAAGQLPLADFLTEKAQFSSSAARTLAYWLLIVAGFALIVGAFRVLSGLFEKLMLGWLDRGFGALILGLAAAFWLLVAFNVIEQNLKRGDVRTQLRQSVVYRYLVKQAVKLQKAEGLQTGKCRQA